MTWVTVAYACDRSPLVSAKTTLASPVPTVRKHDHDAPADVGLGGLAEDGRIDIAGEAPHAPVRLGRQGDGDERAFWCGHLRDRAGRQWADRRRGRQGDRGRQSDAEKEEGKQGEDKRSSVCAFRISLSEVVPRPYGARPPSPGTPWVPGDTEGRIRGLGPRILPRMNTSPTCPVLRSCARCDRVELDSVWVEPEHAIVELRTFEWPEPPRLSPESLGDCTGHAAAPFELAA
jgi:hypothetical protein